MTPGRTIFILYLTFTHGVVASEGSVPERKKKLSPGLQFLRDAGIALALVLSILVVMYAYTGLWPPLVVVESDSMMHSNDNTSYIGAIDTGDLVLVKDVDSVTDIHTYMDGYTSGHKTYGDYGDVVIYRVNGQLTSTPIIHRAMIYLQGNADGVSYSAPSLRDIPDEDDKWSTSNPSDTWDHLTSTLTIRNVGYRDTSTSIDIGRIITAFRQYSTLPSGYITKGDHNLNVDQSLASRYSPVKLDWVVGIARGEMPWFGLLKLWATDSLGSPAPENSVRNLWISMAFIVAAPIVVDVVLTFRMRKKIARRRVTAQREFDMQRQIGATEPVETPPPPPEPPAMEPIPPQDENL